jgi:GTP cyclohydrolase I
LQLLPRSPLTHKSTNHKFAAQKNGKKARLANEAALEPLVREILTGLGEDPDREGLRRTPKRVAAALTFLTAGYQADVMKILNNALFEEQYNEMVIVKDIDFYSLCEHHLLPFYGKCHVAYVPNGRVVGLSKIPRIVDVFARRQQVQERMTNEIAKMLMEILNPAGVAVVTEARHLCMMMRGVQKQNTVVTNSAVLGIFHDDRACRDEFMQLIGHRQMG